MSNTKIMQGCTFLGISTISGTRNSVPLTSMMTRMLLMRSWIQTVQQISASFMDSLDTFKHYRRNSTHMLLVSTVLSYSLLNTKLNGKRTTGLEMWVPLFNISHHKQFLCLNRIVQDVNGDCLPYKFHYPTIIGATLAQNIWTEYPSLEKLTNKFLALSTCTTSGPEMQINQTDSW